MTALHRIARQALILLALAAALAGAPGGARAETTLKVVMHSDLKSFDPVWSGAYIVRNYGYMVYDVLFAMDAKFSVQPQMAESISTSADGLTHLITLREGLMWHDGTPVTAEDCVASLKRWSARDPMGQKLADFLKEYRVIDARRFEIVLKEKFGPLLEALGKPSVTVPFMMPKRVAATDPFKQIDDTIGSGPFILKKDEWKPGEKVVFVKNPNYQPRSEPPSGLAGAKVVKLDRVEWIWIPDAQTQVNALLSGEVDELEVITPDLLPLIENNGAARVVPWPVSNQYVFRMNWLIPPFNNPKIRQAAFVALRQQDFLEATVGDKRYWRLCKALFTCNSPLATEAGMADLLNGDAAKASAMLKEAGYDGTPVVLLQPSDLGVLTNLAPVAKSQLERAGFKVELQSMDWQSLVNRVISKKGPITEGGWNAFATSWVQADLLDPLMTPFLAANCEKARAGWPCDAAIEKVRDAYARASAPEEKKRIATEAQVLNTQVVTHIPLGEWYQVGAVRANVTLPEPLPPVTVFWGVEKK
ncbi:MAG TPA: ABC transporter substrate-binding protein [Xanthobacteraceae bacterium]|nr:ABC transporter substrate-binding protein [Xanthobacteraceae bacterium]